MKIIFEKLSAIERHYRDNTYPKQIWNNLSKK